MAKRASKKPKTAKPPKATKAKRKETRENPGIGHNIASLRTAGAEFVERFLKIHEAMDSDMGGYKSDFANLYEEAANDLGLKKSVVTKEFKRILANKKAAEKEAKMAADEREQSEMWRAAMVGTQFELWSSGDLAQPEETAGDTGTAPDEEPEE